MSRKSPKIDPRSEAKKAQQKHWETTGQISSMIGLINYICGSSSYLPPKVRISLNRAHQHLVDAYEHETANNQFINLNLPRGF